MKVVKNGIRGSELGEEERNIEELKRKIGRKI